MSIWFLYQKKKSFLVPTNDDWNLRRLFFCFIIQIFRASSSERGVSGIEKCANLHDNRKMHQCWRKIYWISLSRSENLLHLYAYSSKICLYAFHLCSACRFAWICATSKLIGRWNIKAKMLRATKLCKPQYIISHSIALVSSKPATPPDNFEIPRFLSVCLLAKLIHRWLKLIKYFCTPTHFEIAINYVRCRY